MKFKPAITTHECTVAVRGCEYDVFAEIELQFGQPAVDDWEAKPVTERDSTAKPSADIRREIERQLNESVLAHRDELMERLTL